MADLPVIALFDGLAEPNPGIACGGYVILPHPAVGEQPLAGGTCFGQRQTNNQAEYQAALLVLERLWKLGYRGPVLLRGDSQLVVRQYDGVYACRSEVLQPLLKRLTEASKVFESLSLEWVRREENQLADDQSRLAYKRETGREPPERRRKPLPPEPAPDPPPPVVNGHVLLTSKTCPCRKDDDDRRCPTCDWGLGVCSLCGAAEIELDEPCKGAKP